MLAVIHNVKTDEPRPLPDWNEVVKYFVDGLVLSCPLMFVGFVPLLAGDNPETMEILAGVSGVLTLVMSLPAVLYGLFLTLLSPVLLIRLAETGEISACLRFKETARFAFTNTGPIVIALLLISAAALVIMVPAMLLTFGLLTFPTVVWLNLSFGHMCGQIARKANQTSAVRGAEFPTTGERRARCRLSAVRLLIKLGTASAPIQRQRLPLSARNSPMPCADCRLNSLLDVLYAGDVLKVSILRPQRGVVSLCRRQHNAIGHWQLVIDGQLGCIECQCSIQLGHLSLSEHSDSLQRLSFPTLLKHTLEYLVDADRRNDQLINVLDSVSKEISIGAIGKILQPTGGIDDVHTRSSDSRSTEVSIPLRNPRDSSIGRTGIISIRLL